MAELRLYEDKDGNESVVICADKKEVDEMMEGERLVASIRVSEDVSSWPTDRCLTQER